MKNGLRGSIAAILTAILLCFTAVPASAAYTPAAQTEQVSAAQNSFGTLLSADNFLPDAVAKKRVTAVMCLSDEEVEEISGRLAEHSDVYLVELQDGRYTYYMAVDFRDDDAVYFARLPVMRATSRKLYARSEAMAAQEKPGEDVLLMGYRHIVGELSLHYMGYRLTDALGGEKLPGVLGKVYRACTVADLNIDEHRMAAAIRLAGLLLG